MDPSTLVNMVKENLSVQALLGIIQQISLSFVACEDHFVNGLNLNEI